MRKTIAIFALACAAIHGGVALASIPVRWSVDTFRVRPLVYDCYHGETLDLAADLSAYGEPVDLTGKTAKLYWQTNGMEEVWWVTNATVQAEGGVRNILAATFSGAYDPGAPSITGFIGIEGENYRASFQLNLRHSPGFTPAELELPKKVIDCETVTFKNPDKAPWPLHACDTNSVNALILSYDQTNLTVRFNGKLDLPPDLAPSNWIPVSVGHDRQAVWMPNMGGGGGSLGSINYITDADGKCYPVYATTNAAGTVIQVVGQIPITPMKKTVEEEEFRAVTKEQQLYTNIIAEAAIRLATDNDLYAKFNSLSALGRFISTWDCEAGRPGTEPLTEFIEYKGGDYYIVGKVATNATNFIPNGTIYYREQQSTTPALDDVYVNDIYRHTDDGNWVHTVMAGVMVRWEQIDGSPTNSISYMEATTNLAFTITTQTVTKAYVEALGIQSCDTNKVNDLIATYDATNLTARINARVSTNDVQAIIDENISTNHVASYDLAQSKIAKPEETVPAGYSLVRGTTNLTDWVLLPSTNIVGYLGYIRDTSGNAYRVIAEPNPEGSVVAAIEQTPTPMPIITIEEERDARIAGDLAATNYANLVSLAATNYTDLATNALDLSHQSKMSQLSQSATNYTDTATNALSASLTSLVSLSSQASTNFTIAATNALDIAHQSQMSQLSQSSTNFTIAVSNALAAAISATNAALRAALDAEATARAAADAAIRGAIGAAFSAATNYTASAATAATNYTDSACATIDGRVTAETTRATAAETTLQNNITAEATTRATADTALNDALAAEITDRADADTALTTALTNETTARQAADAVLTADLKSAATASTNYTDAASAAQTAALAAETTRATAAENTLTSAVSAEATARTTADNTLTSNLNNEIALARGNENALQTAINNEKSRAEAAEANLQTAINTEASTRAAADTAHTTAITTLGNDLSDEASARAAADTTLQGNIDDEINNRVAACTAIDGRVTSEATARANADALLIPLAQKAANNGVATLDGTGKVPVAQLPTGLPVAWGNITGTIANQTDLTSALAAKQDALPATILDYYLHANHVTGELEWKGITGGDISNYNALAEKPIINGNVLTGGVNLASADLGLMSNLVYTTDDNGKVLGVTNNALAWVAGGGGGGTNENYREKSDYAYYAEDYYDLEPLKEALGIDYAYLVLADEKFRKHSTSTHWRWYMYNADFELIGRSQEYSSPENAHASIINIECALGWAFLYKKSTPGPGIKTNRRIITEYEAGIEGGYQTNLIVNTSDNGKVLGIANNKLSWVEGGSGGPTDTLILNGDEDIITGPYVIPHGYGEEGQMLVSKGTNAPPEWSDQPIMVLNGTITNAIGPVVIPGGYGQKGQILVGNGASSPTWLGNGTAGQMLVSGGANADPTWQSASYSALTKTSAVTQGSLNFYRMGKLCVLNLHNIMVDSMVSGLTIGNLPDGCYPKYQMTSVGASGNAQKYCCICVMPNGTIVLYGHDTEYNIYGELFWICE